MADEYAPMEITLEELMGLPERTIRDEELATIRYRPTLVIGAGGTGTRIVRKIKRRVRRYFPESRWNAFQYLAIDTTEQEDPGRGEEMLENNEFYYLQRFRAGDIIDLFGKPGGNQYMAAWWPSLPDGKPFRVEYSGQGAHRHRPLGRLCLFDSIAGIRRAIADKIGAAITILDDRQMVGARMKVYIVGSLAGGTGSGMMLDLAYLSRHEAKQAIANLDVYVTGLLVMPDAYVPKTKAQVEANHFQANAYAALMEINHFSAKQAFDVQYSGNVRVSFDEGTVRPFDVAYVVGLSGPRQKLASVDELTEMLSLHVVGEILSKAGDPMADRLDNIGPDADNQFGGQPTAFSSLAYASIQYPAGGLAAYFALKDSTYLIRDILLGQGISASNVEEDVRGAISRARLDEDPGNQLTDELRERSGEKLANILISPDVIEDTDIEDMERDVGDYLGKARDWQTRTRRRVQEVTPRRMTEVEVALGKEFDAVVVDPERGLRYADFWLQELEKRLQAFLELHMVKEQTGFADQATVAERGLALSRDRLRQGVQQSPLQRRAPFIGINPRVELESCISGLNQMTTSVFEAEIRRQAAEIYRELIRKVRQWRQNLRHAIARLEAEAERRHTADAYARWSWMEHTKTYALTRSVVTSRRINELKEAHTLFKAADDLDVAPAADAKAADRRMVDPELRARLASEFWTHLRRLGPEWHIDGSVRNLDQLAHATWTYVRDHFREKLAASTVYAESMESWGNQWVSRVEQLVSQAEPFWPLSPGPYRDVIQEAVFPVRLFGYGEHEEGLVGRLRRALNDQDPSLFDNASRTEMAFVFTEHVRPLFELASLQSRGPCRVSYDYLREGLQRGSFKVPLHTSREYANLDLLDPIDPAVLEERQRQAHAAARAKRSTRGGSGAKGKAAPARKGAASAKAPRKGPAGGTSRGGTRPRRSP